MKPCTKLLELPTVATEWQQTTWCPDCDHYDQGMCSRPAEAASTPCPLDAPGTHLRVLGRGLLDQPQQTVQNAAESSGEAQSLPPPPGLDHAIQQRIWQRTGGRLRMLAVEVSEQAVVLRGYASCYYLTQLAIQATLDVIGRDSPRQIELQLQVMEQADSGSSRRKALHQVAATPGDSVR